MIWKAYHVHKSWNKSYIEKHNVTHKKMTKCLTKSSGFIKMLPTLPYVLEKRIARAHTSYTWNICLLYQQLIHKNRMFQYISNNEKSDNLYQNVTYVTVTYVTKLFKKCLYPRDKCLLMHENSFLYNFESISNKLK